MKKEDNIFDLGIPGVLIFMGLLMSFAVSGMYSMGINCGTLENNQCTNTFTNAFVNPWIYIMFAIVAYIYLELECLKKARNEKWTFGKFLGFNICIIVLAICCSTIPLSILAFLHMIYYVIVETIKLIIKMGTGVVITIFVAGVFLIFKKILYEALVRRKK